MIYLYFSGFADEAADSIEKQIKVTKELGWEHIEARNIDGTNITDITEEKFEKVYKELEKNRIKVNCFGSAVASWGKNPRDENSYTHSRKELKRAIPRMQKLGTKMIRGMSFGIPKELDSRNPELEKRIISELKKLTAMCEDAGITYVHENCMNYFSQSYEHMDYLLNEIQSPNFKIVFDTGNPVMADNKMGAKPYQKQTSWQAYQHLRDRIAYVHIKDCVFKEDTGGIFPEMDYKFAGKGDGQVKKIIKDLLENGYNGGFSIEPHMGAVYHDQNKNKEKNTKKVKYNTYLEYGKRFMKLMDKIKKEIEEENKNEKN